MITRFCDEIYDHKFVPSYKPVLFHNELKAIWGKVMSNKGR